MSPQKKVVFFGFSDVGYKSLKLLLDRGCAVPAVFTHDTDPHEKQWFETCESLALKNSIPVYKPKSLKAPEWAELVKSLEPDLILSLYYRNFIPPAVFESAKLGAYNMHGSYLPRYRGRAPLNWSIINGETYCGVSLHVLEEGFDTGDIVDRQKVEIGPEDYVGDVLPKISAAAVDVLSRSLDSLLGGSPKLEKQDASKATYFGKRTPEDGRIDFSKSAREVFNLIRGVSRPFPGAFFERDGVRRTIWRAQILPESAAGFEPGRIVSEKPLKIACKDYLILATDFV
ncbi:MAG: formyltransferase [Opitutales bacterium]|nr:formyltransferase [Opitutales bacterium]